MFRDVFCGRCLGSMVGHVPSQGETCSDTKYDVYAKGKGYPSQYTPKGTKKGKH